MEQKSFYVDLDNEDQNALHFLGIAAHQLVAYGRTHQKGGTAHIRRICVSQPFRNQGIATALLQTMLKTCPPFRREN